MDVAMNNEAQNTSTAFSTHEQSFTGPWGLGFSRTIAAAQMETSDYAGEDTGCRGRHRGHSAEFKQILQLLGGC
jgi:hypothetical protein